MARTQMKPLQVGLLGMGTVGLGTWTVLRRNEEEITRRAGRPIDFARQLEIDAAARRNAFPAVLAERRQPLHEA